MNDVDLLDAAAVRELLVELGRRLDARGVEARLFLVGGAAMALAYSRERVTRDLDAVFEPKAVIYEEAAAMAFDRGLVSGWLNDAVKGLLPDLSPPIEGSASFSTRGLHVGVASTEYLFAMKAAAARQETDGADLRLLIDALQLTSSDAAFELLAHFYSPSRLGIKTQLIIEDLFAE